MILGLPPMSQYDAAATPMWCCFAKVDSKVKNTKQNNTARISNTLDFSKEDRIPDLLFSEVIWKLCGAKQRRCRHHAAVPLCMCRRKKTKTMMIDMRV